MCKSTELVSERDWIEIQIWLCEKFILWPVLTLPHASTGSNAARVLWSLTECKQLLPYLKESLWRGPGGVTLLSCQAQGKHVGITQCWRWSAMVCCAQGTRSVLESCAEGLGLPCGISQPSNTQRPSSSLQRHYRQRSSLFLKKPY